MAIAKFAARDCELSTTGTDSQGRSVESWKVTQDVLRHIDAIFDARGRRTWTRRGWGASSGIAPYHAPHSSDCLRHWGPSGQCYYSDMSHVEVCTAITVDPRQYASQCLSTLLVVEEARQRAQEHAEPGTRYSLSTANVDMLDPAISWGTHDNVTVSTALWEELFVDVRRPAVFGFVGSSIAAAIPFFGSGHLIPMRNGHCIYSLSGRAAHITRVQTLATTEAYRRGLLNSRREPHAREMERLHLIGFDYSLICSPLKCCFLQCCLAAAEEGFAGLGLYDPVRALHQWSWKLDLRTREHPSKATLVDGRKMSLPQYMRAVAKQLLELVEMGLITDAVAPDARELLPAIVELTHYADEGSLGRCAKHLDWAAKLMHLQMLCQQHGLALGDPATRLADHDFGNTDPQIGTFWKLWDHELVDPLVGRYDVEACLWDGPAESRAWGQGRLIQQFYNDVADVDWGYVELLRTSSLWGSRLRVNMPSPDSYNRARLESILDQASTVDDLWQLLRNQNAGNENGRNQDDVGQAAPELPLAVRSHSVIVHDPNNGRN